MGGMANLILSHPLEALIVIASLLVVVLVCLTEYRRASTNRHLQRHRRAMEDARAHRDFLAWERARQQLTRDRGGA